MIPGKLVYVAFMEQVTFMEVTCYYFHGLFMDPCKNNDSAEVTACTFYEKRNFHGNNDTIFS